MKIDSPPYSYRSDPNVPSFPERGAITVMDAHCALCARGARWIAHSDTDDRFRIVPLQSTLGNALMRHYGLDPTDPSTWLYLEDGRAFPSLDALIRVGHRLGGKWHTLGLLRMLPPGMQNYLYRLVARHRYRLSGTADLCSLPDPEVRRRLIR